MQGNVPEGIVLDETRGLIKVSTVKALDETTFSVIVNIGSQRVETQQFSIEVFDCKKHITFPTLLSSYRFQMGQKVMAYSIQAFSNSPLDCTLSAHNIKGRSDGTIINAQSNEMIVDTSVSIESTERQISVVVGSQVISSNTFKFEIFDCGKSLYFKTVHKVQMDSTTQVIKLLENSNKVDCKAVNYKIDGLAKGLVLDAL